MGATDRKVLILTDGVKPNVFLSGRNLPTVHVMPYGDVSTYHILWSDLVLIESGAIGNAMDRVHMLVRNLAAADYGDAKHFFQMSEVRRQRSAG